MTDTTAGELAAMLQSRVNRDFDGECHLTDHEAYLIIKALASQPSAGAQGLSYEESSAIERCLERQPGDPHHNHNEGPYIHSDIAQLLETIERATPGEPDPYVERMSAEADAILVGTGFMVDGRRVCKSRIEIIEVSKEQPDIGDVAVLLPDLWQAIDAAIKQAWQQGHDSELLGEDPPELQAVCDKLTAAIADRSDVAALREADRKWLAGWLSHEKQGGHCGEGTFERRERADWSDRIDRILAALSKPNAPGAPEDGVA